MKQIWTRRLLFVAAIGLLAWSLSAVTAADVGQVLRELRPTELLALVLLNTLILATLSARWWLLLYAQGHTIPFLRLITYRLTAFGISYLTPGPHFGGEPWQVFVVARRHQVPYADSIAAVTLDKIVEMLVNFTFMMLGILFILQQQIQSPATLGWMGEPGTEMAETATATDWALQLGIYVLILLAIPVALLLTYRRGRRPISGLLVRAFGLWQRLRPKPQAHLAVGPNAPNTAIQPLAHRAWFQTVRHSEAQITHLCRHQGRILLAAVIISAISWLGMALEFWLMTAVLGLALNPAQALLALLAARVAILLPMPAALGALEAGQSLVMTGLGRTPAAGIGLALLIRARDTLLALAGLWIGGFGVWNLLRGRTPTLPREATPAPVASADPGEPLSPAKGGLGR